MPTYNQVQHIAAAVESVLAQDYDDFDLVISDNHCADGTTDYLAGIRDPRVSVVRPLSHLPTAGENFDYCVSQSRGQYITFFSSDNLVHPRFAATLAPLLDRHPSAAFAYCAAELIDGDGRRIGIERPLGGSFFREGRKDLGRFIAGTRCVFDAMLMRRSCLLQTGGLSVIRGGRRYHDVPDWDLDLRLLLTGDIVYHDEILVQFRFWNGANRDHNKRRMPRYIEEIGRMFNTTVADILLQEPWLAGRVRRARRALAINCACGVGQLRGTPDFESSVENVLKIDDCLAARAIIWMHRRGLSAPLESQLRLKGWLRARAKLLLQGGH